MPWKTPRTCVEVPDPRDAQGQRYPVRAHLHAATAAVLAGACSLIAISEWLADAPQYVLGALGSPSDSLNGRRAVPHSGMVRRLLKRVDGDAPDPATSAYLQVRTPLAPRGDKPTRPVLRPVAVEGKTVRGSRTATAVQLLAAMDNHGVVLAQQQVSSKSNQLPSWQPLPANSAPAVTGRLCGSCRTNRT
ncbi:transposase family protein [Streptomyces fagopyri]|uniref:transposase family protein n=1 Tax=Streptomyces fagopyri TaxID=2662397 RepID=UPI0033F089F6